MFNLANILSGLNLTSGVLAILLAFFGRLDFAVYAILAGAIFDFFDGFAARLFKSNGEMGKQLDSLADVVTFGVAPGVIMMILLMIDIGGFMNNPYPEVMRYDFMGEMHYLLDGTSTYFIPAIALLLPFFAMFRLAKFNIDKRQRYHFIGLPTPACTLFFMSFPLMVALPGQTPDFLKDYVLLATDPYLLSGLIVLFGILMISEIPLFSLKFKSFTWNGNEIRWIFLLISIGIIVVFRTWSLALIVFLYLILSLVQINTLKKQENEI